LHILGPDPQLHLRTVIRFCGPTEFTERPDAFGLELPSGLWRLATSLAALSADYDPICKHEIAQHANAKLARSFYRETMLVAPSLQVNDL